MSAPVVGIDPNSKGAVVTLNAGEELVEIFDMATTPEANGRTATNAPLLAGILARSHARVIYCEYVDARPTDAKVAAFALWRGARDH